MVLLLNKLRCEQKMEQEKYQIQEADLIPVERWLYNRIAETRRVPYGRPAKNIPVVEEFRMIDKKSEVELTDWCESYLNKEQWHRLKGIIRAYRLQLKRVDDDSLDVKRIAVTIPVHEKLKQYANANKLNLSQAIDELLSQGG